MFNEEIKTRYKAEREQTTVVPANSLIADFAKTEPYELKLNKDIYDFTFYEILDMYKTLNIKELDYVYVLNSRLKQYVQWALLQNLVADNQNHFAEITRETLIGCINQTALKLSMVKREQILAWCSQLPNPQDQFILLGLYEGMNGKENSYSDFFEASMDDIDKENNIIRLVNRTITISDKLIEYAEECNNTFDYYAMSGNQQRKISLVETGKIIKRKNNQRVLTPLRQSKSIYSSIKRVCNILHISDWFNGKVCSDAGLVNYICEQSKVLGITPHQYIYSEHKKEAENQYGRGIVESSFYKKYRQIFEERVN